MVEVLEKYIDKDFEEALPFVWDILQYSYSSLGGLHSYLGFRSFKRGLTYIKVVRNKENKIIACATYINDSSNNYKMTAIGCDGTSGGKEALQEIIKSDIQEYNLHYWVEASGAVEHYFKKFGGYPIPNKYVEGILNKTVELEDDGSHYKRVLYKGGDAVSKMIFGFKSDELYNEIYKDIDNYLRYRDKVLKEFIHKKEDAEWVINTIFDGMEQEIYEIPLWLYEALKSTLQFYRSTKDRTGCDKAESLLYEVSVLELNKF